MLFSQQGRLPMLSRTDRVSSTECDRCPYVDHAVLGIRRQKCVAAVKSYVNTRCAALEVKIARLEAALEQKNFASVGVLKGGATYNANSFVTDRGSIWFCRQTTKERPGDGNTSWVLACKGGRDGRDATALPR
jgi:hypothetical protein